MKKEQITIFILVLFSFFRWVIPVYGSSGTNFTEVSAQGAFQNLSVKNYTRSPPDIVNKIVQTAENSIISHPSQPLEHFGQNDLFILTKYYFVWIKNTVTPVRIANNTGNGGGMMKGFWTINGNNTDSNFKFGDRNLGVVNELGRSGHLESDGCALAVQIGSGEDTGNAYFANFSTNATRGGAGYFPQKDILTGIGIADIYWFSGTMRNTRLNKETINGDSRINYSISYHVNNDNPLIEVNPALEATGPVSEVAVVWNSCEVNGYFTPLKYLKYKANAYFRGTWGTSDERAVYLTDSPDILTIKKPSDVWGQPNIPSDGDFRDTFGFSNTYKTETGRTKTPTDNYRPVSEGKIMNKAGSMPWVISDLLGDPNYSSLALSINPAFDNRTLIFRVYKNHGGPNKQGTNSFQFMSATFTDYFAYNPGIQRPAAPYAYDSLEQDPSVISLEAILFHKNAYVQDVTANGRIIPFIDIDGNQITEKGNKNFDAGRIWNFVYQFGHTNIPNLPSPTPIPPTPTPIPGDITGPSGIPDGKVNIYDYNLLIGDFGKTGSPADINGNGIVDIFDYNILVGNFGKTS